METVEFKVEMVGIHQKRLKKCLSKLRGIEKVEVDANSQKVAVTGYGHRNKRPSEEVVLNLSSGLHKMSSSMFTQLVQAMEA